MIAKSRFVSFVALTIFVSGGLTFAETAAAAPQAEKGSTSPEPPAPAEQTPAEQAPPEREPEEKEPLEVGIQDVVVVSSVSLLQDQPSPGVSIDREEIRALPHFGDDFYRALRLLPGASGNDITAGFNVRGGLHKDVLVRIDGLEIFEPFHLKDFQGVFSVLDPEVVDQVELMPGAFTADYGDRATAVLDMTTRRPDSLRTQLGISFSNAWVGNGGTFAKDKGR